jgi:hypothetical protein
MTTLNEIPKEIIESYVLGYLQRPFLAKLRLASKSYAEYVWGFIKVPKALGWPFPTNNFGIVQVPKKMETWPLALKTGTLSLSKYSYTCYGAYICFDENPFTKEPFSWYHSEAPHWLFIHRVSNQIVVRNYTIDKLSFANLNSCSTKNIQEFIKVLDTLKSIHTVEYIGNNLQEVCGELIGEFANSICNCKCKCLDLSNTNITYEFLKIFIRRQNPLLTTLIVKGNFGKDQQADIRKLLGKITAVF